MVYLLYAAWQVEFYDSYIGIIGPKCAEKYYLGMPRGEQRFSPFRAADIPCATIGERVNIMIAHELGHAVTLLEMLGGHLSNEDDRYMYFRGSEVFGDRVAQEYASLPLKRGSTEAGRLWESNKMDIGIIGSDKG